MPGDKLKPDETLELRFRVPRRRRISYYVDSDVPVNTYVVDKDGLEEFLAGEPITSYGGFTNRRVHEEELDLDFTGNWYLLISNPGNEVADISYDVEA